MLSELDIFVLSLKSYNILGNISKMANSRREQSYISLLMHHQKFKK